MPTQAFPRNIEAAGEGRIAEWLSRNGEPIVPDERMSASIGRRPLQRYSSYGPPPRLALCLEPELDKSADGFGTCYVIQLCPCLNTGHEPYGDAKRKKRVLPGRGPSWLTFRSNLY